MKSKNVLYAGIAILVLGIGFAVGTYAYYTNTITGTATGTVLTWTCTADGQTASFTKSMGAVYPGTSGSVSFAIASNIAAQYTITFALTNMGSGSNHPNLNIYKDSGHATVINNGGTITGNVAAGGSSTVNVYHYWPYGTASETYNSSAPSYTMTIECRQV